ncbi:MAG: AI-2E family transporter [Propionibacterium sp.]|nr:AI-2E family transporter [Propionibacterium sp.]
MFGPWKREREFDHRLQALESRPEPVPVPEPLVLPERPRLWSDNFGRVATRALQLIIVLVILAAAIWGMQILSTVAIPIVLALIFSSTFWPLTRTLRRTRMPHALIAAIELLGILLLLSGVGWLVTWAVTDQWGEISLRAQEGFTQLIDWADDLPFAFTIPDLDEIIDVVVDFVTTAQFGAGALAGVSMVATFFTGLVLMVVVLFFFLKDGPEIWAFLQRPFSGASLARTRRIGEKTVQTLGAYVRGTATVALVDSVFIGIGLVVLGVPLAVPLAVLVFLLSFIPLVGATVAGALAALVALVANGPVNALLVVGVVVLVNQLEGNFLQPVVMGRALKLHALVILLALTIGTILAGILGAVLAVPIAAVVWGVIKVWDGPDLAARWFRAPEPEL